MSTVDWDAFSALPWESSPVRLPGQAAPLDPSTAYAAVRLAAAPYRQGTRFRALPAVQYRWSKGQIGAPGELLPGPDDNSIEDYERRHTGEPFLLTVREPFFPDYDLWAEVRDLVEPLWQRIGVPVVPVKTELALTDGLRLELSAEDGYHSLLWVLRGELKVEFAESTSTAAAGDLLAWPSGPATVLGSGCVWLRLLVPADGGLAARQVSELLLTRLQVLRGSDATPYLPLSEAGQPMRPLVETASRFLELSNNADVERSLRVAWAKRVSAAALDPVPPGQESDLAVGQRVRSAARIVRMPDGDRWIWAMNGHAFVIGGGEALLDQLAGGELEVRDDAYLPLLRRLHSLRAVEVIAND
jgi:hypothetical protein